MGKTVIPDVPYFKLKEHELFSTEYVDYIKNLELPFCETEYEGIPKYLGIVNNRASYYIGASWLVKDSATINTKEDKAVVVTPKIENIDFVEMFILALRHLPSANYFSKFYGINLQQPFISCNIFNNQLTPLLIIHFISVMQEVVAKNLKRGYIVREENLNAKIKGKIVVSLNTHKNILHKRDDHVYCRFQEYTTDIPENRLLKKALLFANKALNSFYGIKCHKGYAELQQRINHLLNFFDNVSDQIEVYQIKNITSNKLFSCYNDATLLAKIILKRFDYSINEAGEQQETIPPFWIDMSRLYEVYVYSKLEEAYPGLIKFQEPGHCKTAADFIKIDERLIIDTKYKPHYDYSSKGILNDIREISGYARDEKILKALKINKGCNLLIPCLIIYPEPVLPTGNCLTDEERNELSGEKDNPNTFFNSQRRLLDRKHPIKYILQDKKQ